MKKLLLASVMASCVFGSASASFLSEELGLKKPSNPTNSVMKLLEQDGSNHQGNQLSNIDPFDFRPGLCSGVPSGGWVGPCQCSNDEIVVCHVF